MKFVLFFFSQIFSKECLYDSECGKFGSCQKFTHVNQNSTFECVCLTNTLSSNNDGICDYQQYEKLTAFLLTFLTGMFGIDRCVMARGTGGGICLGILKGITFGGFGIWALIDWIMVLSDSYLDGNWKPIGKEWVDNNPAVSSNK